MIRGTRLRAVGCAAALLIASSAAAAPGADRKAPTTPTNLRVTGTTAYSVSFAWSGSTDNSGSFTYRLTNNTAGGSVVVPGTQTTFTLATGLRPGSTYAFVIYAVDGAGNWSHASNSVSATLPRDTTTPAAPQISLTDVGPTHLTLAFTAQDDDPRPIFVVSMDGSVLGQGSADASIIVTPLAPASTYSFTVQARDGGGNWSPVSAPFTASTDPGDPADTTPPTTPVMWGGPIDSCEVMFFWNPSSDDVTPAEFIVYRLSVNGVFVQGTTLGRTQAIEYGIVNGPNRFELVAVDEAGNVSAPAVATFDLSGCITF
jgi:chitodextrinase